MAAGELNHPKHKLSGDIQDRDISRGLLQGHAPLGNTPTPETTVPVDPVVLVATLLTLLPLPAISVLE